MIEADLPDHAPGGAIRRNTEELAECLRAKGIAAAHFHAGLPPETKKNVQSRFIGGELRVIAATVFGMGSISPTFAS